MSMQDVFWAFVLLGMLLIVSRLIRQNVGVLRRIFLPSSIIAGALALVLGPQVLGAIAGEDNWLANGLWPSETPGVWAALPGLLINVVFAALLMGRPIPGLRTIWNQAGPQVCFGQTLAWGQYVVGILLTMLILTPFFDIPAVAGALIEIGFEGGHGTAAGMREAFIAADWEDGADLALGLATIGLVGGVIIGTILVNWAARKGHIKLDEDIAPLDEVDLHTSDVTTGEIRELQRDKQQESQPTDPLSLHLGLVAVAIGLGWLILEGLKLLEANTWGYAAPDATEDPVRVFTHVPLFPLAMIGGVIIQITFDRLGKSDLISDRLMSRISGAALDFTIVAALGALSLQAIGANLGPFVLLAGAGIAWSVFGVFVLAPRIIPTGWFERGVGDFGQSMGVTVTGLLLMRVADPPNKSGAMQSFGYKQLMFEPVVGGGLFTGASVGLIVAFGSGAMLTVTLAVTIFWIVFGFLAFGRAARQNRAAEAQARQ
ncbi:sodium/glutamate symporter [Phycisphaerales bacterium AB-hyl4]|uniref:Sodium/glutamate symporter n=1 Tax=Natronomicrosphaera hydrolytica TaxID=3242702 RepID=A0ABV4U934_9BACT